MPTMRKCTLMMACLASTTFAAQTAPTRQKPMLHVRLESGWGQTLLCNFLMDGRGEFEWYAKGTWPAPPTPADDPLAEQCLVGRLPAETVGDLLQRIAVAQDGPPALDAGQATFTWTDDRGASHNRLYTHPTAGPCASLLATVADAARKYGRPLEAPARDLAIMEVKLAWGSPAQKGQVLDRFMDAPRRDLVPNVIDAILDDTVLPRHDDTGWGRVYHQAASAMCRFARTIDGKTPEQRGRTQYSFHDDAGVAGPQRLREVHRNWLEWWTRNQPSAQSRAVDAGPPVSG